MASTNTSVNICIFTFKCKEVIDIKCYSKIIKTAVSKYALENLMPILVEPRFHSERYVTLPCDPLRSFGIVNVGGMTPLTPRHGTADQITCKH